MNLGTLIDKYHELREEKRKLEESVKPVTKAMEELQAQILAELENQGLPKATGHKASVSRAETVVANVKDWDAVYQFMVENEAFYLMEKRIANAAYRELMAMTESGQIPGIEPFTKVTLNMRTL